MKPRNRARNSGASMATMLDSPVGWVSFNSAAMIWLARMASATLSPLDFTSSARWSESEYHGRFGVGFGALSGALPVDFALVSGAVSRSFSDG